MLGGALLGMCNLGKGLFGRPFHPSVPSSIHPSSSSRKKKMMEEEEEDDKWRQQQFITVK
jgi:hypothetical protein